MDVDISKNGTIVKKKFNFFPIYSKGKKYKIL